MTLNEIIECIKEVKEDYWEDDGYGYATADCQRITTALDEAIERLEWTKWIPVSERLPEKGKQVLCCNRQGSVFTSAITFEVGNMVAFGQHTNIIAWMPLLERYKEVSE